jgi:hypothetical protein
MTDDTTLDAVIQEPPPLAGVADLLREAVDGLAGEDAPRS